LKNYWKAWSENVNEKNSISINQAAYQMIEQLLAPSSRSVPTTSVAATEPVPISRQVTQGTQMVVEDILPWRLSRLLSWHTLQQSVLQYVYGTDGNQQPATNAKGKKQALPLDADEPTIVLK
jgi:hypothetical protein